MSSTIGFYRRLPTPLGADDRLELDAPLGADVLQTLASNATHLARQNELGTLWEHPGGDVWTDLVSGTDPLDPVSGIQWGELDSAGVFVRYAGCWRLRPYGETGLWPKIEMRARIAAPSTYTTGILLVARAAQGRSFSTDQQDFATTTSTSLASVSATIEPVQRTRGREAITCRAATSTEPSEEAGELPLVHLYVGAWCTSGSGAAKGSLSGITIFLSPP